MLQGVYYGRKKNDNTQLRALEADADLLSTAQRWVEGASVNWPLKDGNGHRRVPLPTYPFAGETHLLPVEKVQVPVPLSETQEVAQPFPKERTTYVTKDHVGSGDEIVHKTRNYLMRIFSELSEIPENQLELNSPLENYGINSLLITKLNRKLAMDVGNVSEILFFEARTLSDAALYLFEHHAAQLETFFSGIKPIKNSHSLLPAPSVAVNEHGTVKDSAESGKRDCVFRVDSAQGSADIAIIGLSGCYPMAKNLDEFWVNLASGRDCITEIPSDRWDYRRVYMPDKNKAGITYCKWGGFIENFAQFDPLFFNMSPNEAALTDPQERLFLQVAWETLEDAGYTRTALNQDYRGNVGVFVGSMYAEYQYHAVEQSLKGENIAFNTTHGSIANRVSYFLDLNGPSMAVDTFCSSSLTALHLAAESIHRGECKMAIVGG
mgnify:CR=1 FL=1